MENKDFVIATNNDKKAKELSRAFSMIDGRLLTLQEAGICSDPEEDGNTFYENAKIKAQSALALSGLPAVADDSGLVVDALGGAPGIHSARYAGIDAGDEANIDRLLLALSAIPQESRAARFVSCLVLLFPDGREFTTTGITEGTIGFRRAGQNGFGYDPVFYRKNGKSFAELTDEQKDRVSHRGRAIRKLEFYLRNIHKMRWSS